MKRKYTFEEAGDIAARLHIEFSKVEFQLPEFHAGLDIEAEHGLVDAETNVTDDDPLLTGKIALAHLNEFPDYYARLKKMEAEAKAAKAASAVN